MHLQITTKYKGLFLYKLLRTPHGEERTRTKSTSLLSVELEIHMMRTHSKAGFLPLFSHLLPGTSTPKLK